MTPPSTGAVIVDVFRAFTTAAYAMAGGVERIVLAASVNDARRLQFLVPEALTLADGPRRNGIDLVNSPALIAGRPLGTRTLIMATTNGTVAALAASDSKPLLCASFVNAGATADYLRDLEQPVSFVASGGPGASEDVSCAAYIESLVADPTTDVQPYLQRAERAPARDALRRRVDEGDTGVHPLDVDFCLQLDTCDTAMVGVRSPLGIELRPARDIIAR